MTIEELKQRKKSLGLTNEDLAKASGVPLGTVQKVMSGATAAPRKETLAALEAVLRPAAYSLPKEERFVAEPQTAYRTEKKQGEYTLEDYYALPDERRVELIDGIIYDMTSPSLLHQLILFEIGYGLRNQADQCPQGCTVFVAPLDVQLDCDDRTMVQPDVLVICGKEKMKSRHLYGAPDLAIEILSPSTRRKDLFIKGNKYMAAGVREYWVVDPDKRQIIQFDYEHDAMIRLYTFEQTVPVLISEGMCKIDFAAISERMKVLSE